MPKQWKQKKKKKKSSRKPSQGSLEASKSIKNKTGYGIYTSRQCKPISKGDAAMNKANRVLGLPLTVSTQRVESITSKETVTDEVLVLAKYRSEDGSRKIEDLTLKSHKE